MEVLGFRFKKDEDEKKARAFIHLSNVIRLSGAIEETTIRIRKQNKLRLPDSIIAATAVYSSIFGPINRNHSGEINFNQPQKDTNP